MMAKTAGRATAHRYDVHPGVVMMEKWVADLKPKTGRSLAEWLSLIRKSGPKQASECREWLKKQHGPGTNSAWWLAKKDRITHRFAIAAMEDLDAEARRWLQVAYALDRPG